MNLFNLVGHHTGSAVASLLVRSTPERAVRILGLAGDIVLCSFFFFFSVCVCCVLGNKWVPANLMQTNKQLT